MPILRYTTVNITHYKWEGLLTNIHFYRIKRNTKPMRNLKTTQSLLDKSREKRVRKLYNRVSKAETSEWLSGWCVDEGLRAAVCERPTTTDTAVQRTDRCLAFSRLQSVQTFYKIWMYIEKSNFWNANCQDSTVMMSQNVF